MVACQGRVLIRLQYEDCQEDLTTGSQYHGFASTVTDQSLKSFSLELLFDVLRVRTCELLIFSLRTLASYCR